MIHNWFRPSFDLDLTKVEWGQLAWHASSERLLPAFAERIQKLGLGHAIPPAVIALFETSSVLNAERNQAIIAEATHAAVLLNQIGIKPLALKGLAYLLLGVYPNQAARYLADIDLLISTADLPHAVAHLRQHGYFENEADNFTEFRHHHPNLRRAGLPHIELHHRVGQGVCNRLLPAAQILADAKPLTVGGASFLVPTPTHLANHLILHSQLAHPYDNRIFPPLRALVDLVHIQSRFPTQIDWSGIGKTYRAGGESATLALHLQHANHFLGTNFVVTNLPRLRWYRRLLLNRHPALRFLDPIYLLMSLFSRRLRLVPQILSHPAAWPKVLRTLTSPAFYRNLLAF